MGESENEPLETRTRTKKSAPLPVEDLEKTLSLFLNYAQAIINQTKSAKNATADRRLLINEVTTANAQFVAAQELENAADIRPKTKEYKEKADLLKKEQGEYKGVVKHARRNPEDYPDSYVDDMEERRHTTREAKNAVREIIDSHKSREAELLKMIDGPIKKICRLVVEKKLGKPGRNGNGNGTHPQSEEGQPDLADYAAHEVKGVERQTRHAETARPLRKESNTAYTMLLATYDSLQNIITQRSSSR